MQRIYVVEDDESIREVITYALGSAGYEAVGFENGEDFFAALKKSQPRLVLLDIMLPGDDGLTILKSIRSASNTKTLPVILLTAKGTEIDRVKGLDMGADDYIPKPFGVMELISRVKAVLRRSMPTPEPEEQLVYENIRLDTARRLVYVSDEGVTLTFKEYELLQLLLKSKGRVLSRESIMTAVWDYSFGGESRTLDMHIRSLRSKLGPAGKHIKTVRNVGYKVGE